MTTTTELDLKYYCFAVLYALLGVEHCSLGSWGGEVWTSQVIKSVKVTKNGSEEK